MHITKKTPKVHIVDLCEGNPAVTSGFLSQRTSNAEIVSMAWRLHIRAVVHVFYCGFTRSIQDNFIEPENNTEEKRSIYEIHKNWKYNHNKTKMNKTKWDTLFLMARKVKISYLFSGLQSTLRWHLIANHIHTNRCVDCPACRTTLIATRFRVAVICPIIQVPHCIRVFFYFVWFVFINHIFQFYNELCTFCKILDIYLS